MARSGWVNEADALYCADPECKQRDGSMTMKWATRHKVQLKRLADCITTQGKAIAAAQKTSSLGSAPSFLNQKSGINRS
jgi:hypothetical protein